MVTAELATALPAVLVLLVVGMGALGVARERLQCAEGARVAARLIARGESSEAVSQAAARVIPAGATWVTVADGSGVVVTVRQGQRAVGPVSVPGCLVSVMVVPERRDGASGGDEAAEGSP